MPNPILTKTYNAAGAINPYAIVKMAATAGDVAAATAATDQPSGVADQPRAAAAIGDRVDVVHVGIAEVQAGGAINAGDLVVAGAAGVAIAAAPGVGVNNGVVGVALEDAASGDVFNILLAPQQIQGA